MLRFFIFAYFSWFCVLHQVREDLQKGKGRFPLFSFSLSACVVSECIHVLACACAVRVSVIAIPFGGVHTRTCVCVCVCIVCACASSRAALSKTLLLHLLSEKRRKMVFCVLSGFPALNLIVYHLEYLNTLCTYTNKHGKVFLLSRYLWFTIKLLKTEKTKPCGSSFPSCLSSCLLSEYLRKQKARCK